MRILAGRAFRTRQPDLVSGLRQPQHGTGVGAGGGYGFTAVQQHIRQKPLVALDQLSANERSC